MVKKNIFKIKDVKKKKTKLQFLFSKQIKLKQKKNYVGQHRSKNYLMIFNSTGIS